VRRAHDAIQDLLKAIPDIGADSKILIIGGAARGWEFGDRRKIDHYPTPEVAAATCDPESFDVAVWLDPDRSEWDRWDLQQIHRLLKSGGHLIFAAPNRLSLATPMDLVAFVLRGLREVRRRLAAAAGASSPRFPFVTRGFDQDRLIATLASLGYDVVSARPAGLGFTYPLSVLNVKLAARFAGLFVIHCRRRSILYGSSADRPFPDPTLHAATYEQTNAAFVTTRERWKKRHPEFLGPSEALDPSRFKDRSVLVLAPHPDDEIIGCGGTLLRLQSAGARITVLQATDGSDAAALQDQPAHIRTTIRLEEAAVVAQRLDARLVCWKEDNANFLEKPELVQRLSRLIRTERPALIFVPFVTDIHPDHMTLSRILSAVVVADGVTDAEILNYEVWSLTPTNRYCDVTSVMPEIADLLLLYKTAMKVDDFVHFCQSRNYYNALIHQNVQGFAEAFLAVPSARYPELVRAT
jgi:LmbE family N-acetylglucosaminyl deacetylase